LRCIEQSRLFAPSSLELGELAYEGGEARFRVLVVEPCPMPTLEGIFQRKIQKTSTRVSLEANAAYDHPVCGTRLVFQEEIVFDQGKIWRNPKIGFVEMDKNGDLKNGVRVKMNQFNLVVIQKAAEQIIDWESKSTLEEGGEHHNLVGVGSGDILTSGRTPL
jgi:hypothetical protein